MWGKDIAVAVISRDPFFLFTTRALLGRDRRTRIFDTAPSILALQADLEKSPHTLGVIVCDLDTFNGKPAIYTDLPNLVGSHPGTKVLCLAEGNLNQIVAQVEDVPLSALLAKHDLGFCLHLVVRAIVDEEVTLVTKDIRALLTPGCRLRKVGRTIRPEKKHPNLTPRIEEIVMWRIFIGLDNPDIQDELLLGQDTIREYVSKAYKALGARNEIEAFDALSHWWWVTRFSPAIRESG